MTEISDAPAGSSDEVARFMQARGEDEELWERRYRAMTMRNGGATYGQIAARLQVSPEIARRDVQRVLQEYIRQPAEDMIAQQLSVLHDLRRAHYPRALQADPDSTKAVMKTLEHEAKLKGYYAPERVQIGITDTEFAEAAVALIAGLPGTALSDLEAQAKRDAVEHGHTAPLDAEVVEVAAEDVAPTPPADPAAWADI
jgi:hypothetical protein